MAWGQPANEPALRLLHHALAPKHRSEVGSCSLAAVEAESSGCLAQQAQPARPDEPTPQADAQCLALAKVLCNRRPARPHARTTPWVAHSRPFPPVIRDAPTFSDGSGNDEQQLVTSDSRRE